MSSSTPFVSVIVPAYNEEKFIDRPLTSLANQNYPKDKYEVIVVDNKSSDATIEVAKKFHARIIAEHFKGVSAARAAGFKAAKGDIIACTDADAVLPPNWIETFVKQFEKDPTLVAYGGLSNLTSGARSAQFVWNHLIFLMYVIGRIFTGGDLLIGQNMAVRKEAYEKTGGFNPNLIQGEDTDLAMKLHKIGKVKLNMNFKVKASGRRFKNGLIKGMSSYGPTFWGKIFLHRDIHQILPDFREE